MLEPHRNKQECITVAFTSFEHVIVKANSFLSTQSQFSSKYTINGEISILMLYVKYKFCNLTGIKIYCITIALTFLSK